MKTKEFATNIFRNYREDYAAFMVGLEEYKRLVPSEREAVDRELVEMCRVDVEFWDLCHLVCLLEDLHVDGVESLFLEMLRVRFPEDEMGRLNAVSIPEGGREHALLTLLLSALVRSGSHRGLEIARELQDKYGDSYVGRSARRALRHAPKSGNEGVSH